MAIEMVPWNPFDGATIAPDALPAEFADQTYRFAAAVGAAQGAFEEE